MALRNMRKVLKKVNDYENYETDTFHSYTTSRLYLAKCMMVECPEEYIDHFTDYQIISYREIPHTENIRNLTYLREKFNVERYPIKTYKAINVNTYFEFLKNKHFLGTLDDRALEFIGSILFKSDSFVVNEEGDAHEALIYMLEKLNLIPFVFLSAGVEYIKLEGEKFVLSYNPKRSRYIVSDAKPELKETFFMTKRYIQEGKWYVMDSVYHRNIYTKLDLKELDKRKHAVTPIHHSIRYRLTEKRGHWETVATNGTMVLAWANYDVFNMFKVVLTESPRNYDYIEYATMDPNLKDFVNAHE